VGIPWHGLLWLMGLWSALAPVDRFTWCLDAAPAILIYLVLIVSHRTFRFTPLAYWLLWALMVAILAGSHFGFANVPGFAGFREVEGGPGVRNEFDKFAHFLQGLVPSVVIRELLIRFRVVSLSRLIPVLVIGLTLALSALYELCEWAGFLILGSRAEAFIGSQQDPWDAQSDMAMALLGAAFALGVLTSVHDRSIAECRTKTAGAVPARSTVGRAKPP
jgi:putative membrane protein